MTTWVPVGTDVMKEAMAAQGLSFERAARQIPTTEKTWRRWVTRGEVPIYVLDAVARVLRLEIERPVFHGSIRVPEVGSVPGEAWRDELRERLDVQDEMLRSLMASVSKLTPSE